MLRIVLRTHIWAFCGVVPLLVRMIPLERLIRLLTVRSQPYRAIREDEIIELVRRRLKNPRNMKRRRCLRLGLAMYHLLRLSGRAAVIHFAVYPHGREDRMHAHCWVTLRGRCISEPTTAEAVEMFSFPRAPVGRDEHIIEPL